MTSSIKERLSAPDNVKLVLTLLNHDPAPSRHGLAQELCERLDLCDFKGDWQWATTSKALRQLEEEGLWKLPKPLLRGSQGWNPTRLNRPVLAPRAVPELLREVRGLSLVEVVDPERRAIFGMN